VCSSTPAPSRSRRDARRVPVSPLSVSFSETISGDRRLLGLGLAFIWSAVLVAGVDLLIRAIIARKFGIEGAGIYQASWALSGMFASFVLSAMGADFYPRLTATSATARGRREDNDAVRDATVRATLAVIPTKADCKAPLSHRDVLSIQSKTARPYFILRRESG
jgi:hypothetical protein